MAFNIRPLISCLASFTSPDVPQLSSFLYPLSLLLILSPFSAVDNFPFFLFLALLYLSQGLSSTFSRRWEQEEHGENNRTICMVAVSASYQWSLRSEIKVTWVQCLQLYITDIPDSLHILQAHGHDRNSKCNILRMRSIDCTCLYRVQYTHLFWY